MNALQVINHKTTSRPPIIAKWHMYSNSLEYRIRRCLTAIPMLELKALLRFSHIRGARYEGKKGNADPKHRPLSSAIFGPVDNTSLLRLPPRENFSGGWSFAFLYINPRIPKEDTLDILLPYGIDNELLYVFIAFLLRGPRLASPIGAEVSQFHPCAPLSFDFGFGSFYWLYSKLLRYARGPGHCCAGNYCRSRKKMLYFG